ncbi:cytochrome c5 family protein [Neptuniibacter sp. 1_MG-2023]|uniref:c-type cytochrome n=1 Tax=Neptuniibacter sp. 1_MG-2023 TaxID=3062662 RepID=UPI0026E454BF|nr:c-type cytochrome [Neptuniibacter sp. 1_MG-2023]MDO6592490.1 c-type cytochrome [Neptuniibacter sp. 1_MG-2023]
MGKTLGLISLVLLSSISYVHAEGQVIYDKHCKGCHVAGVGGAPKPGDSAAWEPRIVQGIDVMVQTVVVGKGTMPPKGTCFDCDEAALKAAVELLIAE